MRWRDQTFFTGLALTRKSSIYGFMPFRFEFILALSVFGTAPEVEKYSNLRSCLGH